MAIVFYNTSGKIDRIVTGTKDQIAMLMKENPANAMEVPDAQINWGNIPGMSVAGGVVNGVLPLPIIGKV